MGFAEQIGCLEQKWSLQNKNVIRFIIDKIFD